MALKQYTNRTDTFKRTPMSPATQAMSQSKIEGNTARTKWLKEQAGKKGKGNFLTRTGSAIKSGAKRLGAGIVKHKGKVALGAAGVGAGVAGYYAYRKSNAHKK